MASVQKAAAPSFELAGLADISRALLSAGRRVKVLKALEWPMHVEERFLDTWRLGRAELPSPGTQPVHLADEAAALRAVMVRCDRGHPIGRWLYKTAWSY